MARSHSPSSFFHYLAVVMLLSVLFLAGIAVGRYAAGALDRLAFSIKSLQREITVLRMGPENYARERLAVEYKTSSQISAPIVRTLDTSRLPLILTEIKLAETGVFAPGVGGAVTNVEDTIVAMDRLGNIFAIKNNLLTKIDYGEFPNNLQGFVSKSPDSLNSVLLSGFRTHFISYDRARGTLYVSLEKFSSTSKRLHFNLSAIDIDKNTLEKVSNWKSIFDSEDMMHQRIGGAAGGKMVVSGDILYFTIGDYNLGRVPERREELVAQDQKSSFGKIFEYNIVNGGIKMKAMGFRNPQGLVYTKNGQLIDAEHGPEGGDELNIVVDGKNYGWPFDTYGTDYGTFTWSNPFKALAPMIFIEPLFSWVPSAAVSSVVQIDNFDESWNGDLLVGSLKAQTLYRLKFVEGRIIFSEPIWIGHRIRDITQVGNQIVLMTDDPSLILVEIDQKRLQANAKWNSQAELNPALRSCLACHHFGATNPSHLAPSLSNILHRKIASDDFRGYSQALRAKGDTWDEESLALFLKDPNKFAPGSSMPDPELSDQEVQEVVSILKDRSSTW